MGTDRIGRRDFLAWASRRGLGIGLAGGALPALLAACATGAEQATRKPATPRLAEGRPIVGDVLDFALTSDEWEGAFGFVTLKLHEGVVGGSRVFFIRTDTSDQVLAVQEGLVFVPRLAVLAEERRTGSWYEFENGMDDQPIVLSTDPGRDDYAPTWRVSRARWKASLRTLTSMREVEAARKSGELAVEKTGIVLNAAVVKWSGGEMPVDTELREYLGGGQLIEPPDTSAGEVTFKLHECFPGVRYIVADVTLAPMAEGMHVVHSPALAGASEAGATGRTNVFMNGLEGPGPMGFQPSVFDSQAGEPAWSPYWDHMTYAWKDEASARVLKTEPEVVQARDAGELDEFPGTPDTKGETFTVNCPVPVLAPNTFQG
ncbi:MAG TPA: hypothetical protein VGR49_07760 [Actinomycetota bacterium]|nr:hypothetical protein [Actinomycetota bacterium]